MGNIHFLYMSFNFNVKTEEKGQKLLKKIEQEVSLEFKADDIFNGNDNSWTFSGYFILESKEPNEAVIETLQRVNCIGYNWNVGYPDFEQENYWHFLGNRTNHPKNFRISGINCADFELTNRSPDYIRKSPFVPGEEVIIEENELTIKIGLKGKRGKIIALTGVDEFPICWNYIIEIEGEKVELSESDLLKSK